MNKYLVALLVFNLSLILFGFNAVASAYVSGCTSAGPYNTITGKLCDANEVVTCPTGDLFSSVTGQACTVWQASSVSFSDLRIGSRGESVRTFQQTLAGAGFSPGVIDGIYGPMTSVAAISYYKKYPISSIFPEPVPKALTITTTSPLPNARVGVQYKAYLYASSGFSLYYWSTVFGTALPPGLAFTASEDCGTTSTLPNVSNCILILGTPTTSGNYFPNISVSAGSQSATKQFSLTVDPATTTTAPTIVSLLPTSGPVGTQITITGSGFAVSTACTNSFPEICYPNNTVNFGSVSIKNVSSADGKTITFQVPFGFSAGSVKVSVTNSNGTSNSMQFTVDPATTLTITTTSPLPNARVGVQYKAYLYASSGFSLYYWSTVFGTALPPGLAFTASEDCGTTSTLPNVSNCILILGTPTTSGNYFPNISVSAGSQSATKQFSLTVDPATTTTAPTIVSISILPEGCSSNMGYSPVTGESCANPRLFANFGDTVNIYGSNFTSNNFAFTYSTLSGDYVTMPTKFISSSLLSFVVPSNAGTGQHGIALKKNNDDSFVSNYVSLNFTNITTSTLTITTTSPLPNAKVGTNYTTDLRALCESITCFAAVRQWSVTSGFLPNGLHLSAIDATDTILTGTPTLAGNYNFTLTVTLTNTTGSQSATKQFTLTVDPATIACTVGFDTTTSFRCGCTSTSGYSKITGESCAISYDKYGKVLGAESFNFTQPLQNGSSGNEVMELQKFLNGAGYDAGAVDGKFGAKTQGALIKFQVANGLVGDGVVGPLVRALLNSY